MKDGKNSSELWVVIGLIASVIAAISPALMRFVDQWPAVALIVTSLSAAAVAVTKYISSRTELKKMEMEKVASLAAPLPQPGNPTSPESP